MDKWEQVLNDGGNILQRVVVPGGWLYRDLKTSTVAFVPAPPVPIQINRGSISQHQDGKAVHGPVMVKA